MEPVALDVRRFYRLTRQTVEARNLYHIFTGGFMKKRFTGAGVILDASRPYCAGQGNYFVRIKLVDESLNQFTALDPAQTKQKHIVMLLIANELKDLPRVTHIGSVLAFSGVSVRAFMRV